MLVVSALNTSYGSSRVLQNLDLTVGEAEIVAMVGRNGMGKTTTIRSIMGLVRPAGGRIVFEGRDILGLRPNRIARAGIGLVPEGRQIFPNLTVEENLIATARPSAGAGWSPERAYKLFPVLAERRRAMGFQLSGGEQQMLAIARALLTNPRLLILDEATEGLAPAMRRAIWETIAEARAAGIGVLVVDRDLTAIAGHADRCVVLVKGAVVWMGDASDVQRDRTTVEGHLTV